VNNQVLLLQQGGVELINKSFGMKEAVDWNERNFN
jgi:hypothetical protein